MGVICAIINKLDLICKRRGFLRQIRFLCAVLAVSVLSLTGCADIKDLSEEQENEIAEYAAGVLLQNSDKYPYRLVTKEEKEDTAPTPAAATPTPASAKVTNAPQTSNPAQTTETTPDSSKKEVSLDDLYHLKGVSISYTSYRLVDKYGSSQIRAEQGKKLFVASFSVKNSSTGKRKINLSSRSKITYQLNVDGTQYPLGINMISNGLDYLETTVEKGQKKTAVLIFQVDKDVTNASSIDLSIEEGNYKTSVKIK